MALPNSCEYIGKFEQYAKNMFDLASILIVSKRPLVSTGIMFKFSINFSSLYNYPQHYLEIVLKDLDLSAIQIAYRTPGATIPCTLSSNFLLVASRF